MAKKKQFSFGKLAFWIIFTVLALVAIKHFDKAKEVGEALLQGKWQWVLLAMIVQIVYYPIYSKFLKISFDYFSLGYSQKRLMQVYLATKFTDVALPAATVGKVALFAAEAKKEDEPVISAIFAMMMVLAIDMIAFWLISLFQIFVLGHGHVVTKYYLIVFLFFTLIVSVLSTLGILYFKNKKFAKIIFEWLSRSLQKLGIDLPGEEHPMPRGKGRRAILTALGYALFLQLINMVTLLLVFLAFGQASHLSQVIITYTVGTLFTVVSITPQGAGVAETAMVLTMVAGGMPLSNALLITLAFRGLLYWLPFFAGLVSFNRLKLLSTESSD